MQIMFAQNKYYVLYYFVNIVIKCLYTFKICLFQQRNIETI